MSFQISVIVPVYNAEDTLMRCVSSILGQTFKEFEVLLVNDGSTDNSGKICDSFAVSDNRVRVIHKENMGVSAARQVGIEASTGEYTIHVDSDDWIEPNMLEDMYKCASSADGDMVICDFYKDSYRGSEYFSQKPSQLSHSVVLRELFLHLHGSLCNKLIHRRCYSLEGVHFPEGVSFCEDLYVVSSILKHEVKVFHVPEGLYHYSLPLGRSSLSRDYTSLTYERDRTLLSLFQKQFCGTAVYELVTIKFVYLMISRAFFFGETYYTSQHFKKIFQPFSSIILKAEAGIIEKILLYVSCRGYYKIAIRMANFFMNIKHVVKL